MLKINLNNKVTMHKLMTYADPLLTFLFTLFLNFTYAGVFSVCASILVIIRTLYLIKRDVDKNHDGSGSSWFKSFKKKQQ